MAADLKTVDFSIKDNLLAAVPHIARGWCNRPYA